MVAGVVTDLANSYIAQLLVAFVAKRIGVSGFALVVLLAVL